MVYVVFEGIDGAGKTTQATLLARKLKGFLFHEPYSNELGNYIKKMIKSPAIKYSPQTIALMFAAQRMVVKDEFLGQKVKEEKWVIGDRSFYSSIVYQHALGCEIEWLKTLNKYMIIPDITIVLDISIETFMKRRGETDIIFEKKEFQKKIRELYLKLPTIYPNHNIHIIDGEKSIEEIHKKVLEIVMDYENKQH